MMLVRIYKVLARDLFTSYFGMEYVLPKELEIGP
jgi:hypothetical protein